MPDANHPGYLPLQVQSIGIRHLSKGFNTVMGTVAWITGMSASGKTTFMRDLARQLQGTGIKPIQLDGDELRPIFRAEKNSYDYMGRLALAFQYSDLCAMLAKQGHVVLIATIALFHEIHVKNRHDLLNYVEIFMDTPLETLRARDQKGLYTARGGVIGDEVAGVSWEPEYPLQPHFRVSPNETTYATTLLQVSALISKLHAGAADESGLS